MSDSDDDDPFSQNPFSQSQGSVSSISSIGFSQQSIVANFDKNTLEVSTNDANVDNYVNRTIIPKAKQAISESDEEEEESLHGIAIHSQQAQQALVDEITAKFTDELIELSQRIEQTSRQSSSNISVSTQASLQSVESVRSIVPVIVKTLVDQRPVACTLECIDISCPVFPLTEITKIIKSRVKLDDAVKIKKIKKIANKYALLKFCMKNKIYFGKPHPKIPEIETGVLSYMIDEMLWMIDKDDVTDIISSFASASASAGPVSKQNKREKRIFVLYHLASNPTTNKFSEYIYNLMSRKDGNASSSFVGGNGPLTIILTLENIKQYFISETIKSGSGTLCETVYMVYQKYIESATPKNKKTYTLYFKTMIAEINTHLNTCMTTIPAFKSTYYELMTLFSDYDNFASILSDNKDVINFFENHGFEDLILNWRSYGASAKFMLLRNKVSYQMMRNSDLFRGIDFGWINAETYATARQVFPQFPMFYQMADENASANIRGQYRDRRYEGCATFFDLQTVLKKKKDAATSLFAKTLSEISPPPVKKMSIGEISIARQNVDNIVQLIQAYVDEMNKVIPKKISCETIEDIGRTVMVPLADALKNIMLGDQMKNGSRKPNYSSKILRTAIERMFEHGVLNTDCTLAPRKPPYIASTTNDSSRTSSELRNLQKIISGILIEEKSLFPNNSNSNINSIEIASPTQGLNNDSEEPEIVINQSATRGASSNIFANSIMSPISRASSGNPGGGGLYPSGGGGGGGGLYGGSVIKHHMKTKKYQKYRKTRKQGKRGMRKTRKGAIA